MRRRWKQPRRESTAKGRRILHNGQRLGLVQPHAEEAHRQGHAFVNQGRCARDRLLRVELVYKHRAQVKFERKNVKTYSLLLCYVACFSQAAFAAFLQ